jgi:EAL domain-containing protein (putative c-di-GMP-specific phosphodiesterase class I)
MSASTLLPAATRGRAAAPGDASPPLRRLGRLLSSLSPAADGSGTVGQLGNLRLSSHFQPIYSLSHMRVVGHEALLRARDAQDRFVPPPEVFAACDTLPSLAWCDSLSRIVHLANFTATMPASEWLFLNVNPEVFQRLAKDSGNAYMHSICDHFRITGDKMVIEVLENALTDTAAFEESLAIVRDHGCLIAIDDFGAGHSNFDRVWRIQPDIVKLDRSLVARAARDRRAQRVVSQMVSLLHECGTMVLMEGVETLDEALLALESDADMVQGYFFGRPQPQLVAPGHVPPALTQLYSGLGQRRDEQRRAHHQQLAPYRNAVGNAGVMLSANRSMEEACHAFLELPGAELCYLLDAHGFQIGATVYATAPKLAYEPLRNSGGACWARRPYFRRAMDSIGRVQVTRPYRTLHGNHSCVTASMAFQVTVDGRQELRVIGCDLTWNEGPVALFDAVE